MAWETVIGLEVHVQLKTRTKMFCGCPTTFGDPPNTNVCPVCLGLPGALPVPNAEAIRLATRAALALGCTVHERSVFARKNYFYPDLPKGYQISQFDQPLSTGGVLHFESPERGRFGVEIRRLHVEEDAGKSLHDRVPGRTAVDLNRAGVPLAEIVSGPDLRSPAEAREYLKTLRQVLVYAGISDCSMEQGSLRVDANISIRPAGDEKLYTRAEVKNMNSFANVERALEAERARQIALTESGEGVQQVTLLFNAATGQVKPLRSKEDSHDYRYFPDPDLPPLVLPPSRIADIRSHLPELPAQRRHRFREQFTLGDYEVDVLTASPKLGEYFEQVARRHRDSKTVATWVMGEVLAAVKSTGRDLDEFPVRPADLGELLDLIRDGIVSRTAAKQVFTQMLQTGERAPQIVHREGLFKVSDDTALAAWLDEVITEHPAEVARIAAGEARLKGVLVGFVMKKSKGSADPKRVNQLLADRFGV
jgi:aspartyl-tRNA(Asn)/glutamyl-tRNA(Gln) amidotransferase subunit B